jgi:predicted PurR-regulated permease PerM
MAESGSNSPAENADEGVEPELHWTAARVSSYCLVALAILYTLYFARSLLMPIVVAILFSLMLSPLVETLKRVRVPRLLSALMLISMLGGPFVLLGIELAAPVEKWMAKLPELSARLSEQLDDFGESLSPEPPAPPVQPKPDTGFSFFGWFGDDEEATPPAAPEPKRGNSLVEEVKRGGIEILVTALGTAPAVLAQFALWLILVLFLLIFGPGLYNSAIENSPRVQDKRRATVIVGKVRWALSRYILTVTVINAGLGAVTALVLWLLGVEDALLWGALVGLLNYAPYVGPIVAMFMLAIAGAVQYGLNLGCLVPAAVFFFINLVEAQLITPTILGQHMRLNPLVLILWLVIWGWLWGPVGVLLAVPLLVCLKLTASQLHILTPLIRVIETRA